MGIECSYHGIGGLGNESRVRYLGEKTAFLCPGRETVKISFYAPFSIENHLIFG